MCHNAVLILCFRKSLFLLMLHDGILVLFLPFDFHSCGLSWFSFQELLLGCSFFTIIIFLFLPSGLLLDIFYWKGNAIWVVKSIDNLGSNCLLLLLSFSLLEILNYYIDYTFIYNNFMKFTLTDKPIVLKWFTRLLCLR